MPSSVRRPPDWVAVLAEEEKKSHDKPDGSWQRHVATRDSTSKPLLALARYAGTYRDGWYGEVGLALEGETLVMRFSKTALLVGDLEHWQQDTYGVKWRDRPLNADAFVTFALTPEGAIDSVQMEAVSPLTDFSFDFHDLQLKPIGKRRALREGPSNGGLRLGGFDGDGADVVVEMGVAGEGDDFVDELVE